ncbi:hypothetical protein M422DRAFT_238362 [Sphaerobolus stellatus SS14]|nr:hypothetical protein M422DRAFT_238362 [Sphaerobolus stellatus SS14]
MSSFYWQTHDGQLVRKLTENVDGTKGARTITDGAIPTGNRYLVNIVKDLQNVNILFAQSARFDILSDGSPGGGGGSSSAPVVVVTTAASSIPPQEMIRFRDSSLEERMTHRGLCDKQKAIQPLLGFPGYDSGVSHCQ